MVIMKSKSYKIFYLFCGVLYPMIALGAIVISFYQNIWFGVLTSFILIYWISYSFSTTCCRCQFYGSKKCGLPGIIVPFLFKKKSINNLPRWRIWVNYYNDIFLMVYLNSVYIFIPLIFPFVLASTVLVYVVVYRQKRFHGLMYILKKKPPIKKQILPIRFKKVA